MSGKKGRSGRKYERNDVDATRIEAMALVGTPHHNIAALVGINTQTLLKYYRNELDMGKAKGNVECGQRIFAVVQNPAHPQHITACIYWSKTQMGWRETARLEVGNVPGESFRTGKGPKITKKRAAETYRAMLDGRRG